MTTESATEVAARDRPRRLARLFYGIRDNLLLVATLTIAGYVVIRGELVGFQQKELPFLVALLLAVLGLNAIDSIIDRNTRTTRMNQRLNTLIGRADVSFGELSTLQSQLSNIELVLNGLKLNAVASQFLHDQAEVPRERLRRATTIYWSGATLQASLRQRLPDVGMALSHGASLFILVLDPASRELTRELTTREHAKEEYISGVLKSMILNLQVLAGRLSVGNFFRLGFHQVFPTYGITILDPEDPDGLCIVELYNPDGEACATFNVHATTDAAWFALFVDQFRASMNSCRLSNIWNPDDVEAAADNRLSVNVLPGDGSCIVRVTHGIAVWQGVIQWRLRRTSLRLAHLSWRMYGLTSHNSQRAWSLYNKARVPG